MRLWRRFWCDLWDRAAFYLLNVWCGDIYDCCLVVIVLGGVFLVMLAFTFLFANALIRFVIPRG